MGDMIWTVDVQLSTSRRGSAPDQVRRMRQYVKVTALGSPTFRVASEKVEDIRAKFEKDIPGTVPVVLSKPYEGHDDAQVAK